MEIFEYKKPNYEKEKKKKMFLMKAKACYR